MKYISLLFLILFIQCEQPSNKSDKSWKKTDEMNANSVFKDMNVSDAIEQAIDITEKNNIDPINISSIFTANNLYIYISEAPKECSKGDYYSSPIEISNKKYSIDFNKNEFLNQHVDTSNLKFTPLIDEMFTTGCEINGYVFRYMKNKDGKYQLKKTVRNFDVKPDFISKEDRYLFRMKVIIPEPEPELPIEKEN